MFFCSLTQGCRRRNTAVIEMAFWSFATAAAADTAAAATAFTPERMRLRAFILSSPFFFFCQDLNYAFSSLKATETPLLLIAGVVAHSPKLRSQSNTKRHFISGSELHIRFIPAEEEDVGGLEEEDEEEEDVLMGKEVFPRLVEGVSTLERFKGMTALGGGATLPW